MTDDVYKRFSNQIEGILALLENDATFREICADYAEIRAWLARQDCHEGSTSNEFGHAQELALDLEKDIQKALRDAGY